MVAQISLGTTGTHYHSRSTSRPRVLDPRGCRGPHRGPPPTQLHPSPRTGYHTSRDTDRGRYADTRTSLPVDRHGHQTDFSTWTFTREHRGQRRPDSTHTPSLPGRMLGLHKRRHVAVRSPEWVIAEIRYYPSPARSRARQPR
jgi:hypothetical protein